MSKNLYGKTDAEKHAEAMFKCREIVQEIIEFGVTQAQILRIIKLLSLELENREAMVALSKLTKQFEEGNEPSKIIT
jgi:hypothetical protein